MPADPTTTSLIAEPVATAPATPPRHHAPAFLRTPGRRVMDRALVVLFLLSLFVPLFGTGFVPDEYLRKLLADPSRNRMLTRILVSSLHHWDFVGQQTEKRALAKLPSRPHTRADLVALPSSFTAYFNDHFGFRNSLILLQAAGTYKTFGVSPTPDVVVGKDGWLYMIRDLSLESYTHSEPFHDDVLFYWSHILLERKIWLKQLGIPYIVVIGPDKQSIYPEYLPSSVRQMTPKGRFDQLLDYIHAHPEIDVDIVDPRPALIAAKSKYQLYHKLDAHWKDDGAFIAYTETCKALAKYLPGLKPMDRSQYLQTDIYTSGDLAQVMGLENILKENQLRLRRIGTTEPPSLDDYNFKRIAITTRPDPSLPKLVMFKDSFASQMIPFLAENFSRGVYEWNNGFDPELVKQEHPTVVITQLVERKFYHPLEANAPEVRDAWIKPVQRPADWK